MIDLCGIQCILKTHKKTTDYSSSMTPWLPTNASLHARPQDRLFLTIESCYEFLKLQKIIDIPTCFTTRKMQQKHPHPLFTQSEVKEIQRFLSLLLIIVLPKFLCIARDIYFPDDRHCSVYPEFISSRVAHVLRWRGGGLPPPHSTCIFAIRPLLPLHCPDILCENWREKRALFYSLK